jgi:diaminopimelate epimerase
MPVLFFHKMHGLGNDFVIIERNSSSHSTPLPPPPPDCLSNISVAKTPLLSLSLFDEKTIKLLGDRKLGIGFDQLLIVSENPTSQHEQQLEMVIFNRDASPASFCGNGVRCVAGFYLDIKEKQQQQQNATHCQNDVSILIANRVFKCSRTGRAKEIRVNIGRASMLMVDSNEFNLNIEKGKLLAGFRVNVGNDHVVIFVNDFTFDLEKVASSLKLGSVNVNFAQVISRTRINLRVWEYGAGLTLACGSGACATFYAASRNNLTDNDVDVQFPIGSLNIQMDEQENILMSGPYAYVFSGQVEI